MDQENKKSNEQCYFKDGTSQFVMLEVELKGLINGNEMLVLYLIKLRAGGMKGACWQTHEAMAREIGLTRQTVHKSIASLVKKGIIVETEKPSWLKSPKAKAYMVLSPHSWSKNLTTGDTGQKSKSKNFTLEGGVKVKKINIAKSKNFTLPTYIEEIDPNEIDPSSEIDLPSSPPSHDSNVKASNLSHPTDAPPPPKGCGYLSNAMPSNGVCKPQEDSKALSVIADKQTGITTPQKPNKQQTWNDTHMEVAKAWARFAVNEMPGLKPDLQKWAIASEKLDRLDGCLPFDQIMLLNFIKNDDFWRQNAISLTSLRKKGKNDLKKWQNILSSVKRSNWYKEQKTLESIEKYGFDGPPIDEDDTEIPF